MLSPFPRPFNPNQQVTPMPSTLPPHPPPYVMQQSHVSPSSTSPPLSRPIQQAPSLTLPPPPPPNLMQQIHFPPPTLPLPLVVSPLQQATPFAQPNISPSQQPLHLPI